MGDKLIMSSTERNRKVILEEVKNKRLTLKEASSRMKVCERQAKRIWKRYRTEGDGGLVHRRRGCLSAHAYPAAFKAEVLHYYETKYLGFGATFAAEKLAEEEGLHLHGETLRLWLKAAGLWHIHRRRKGYRTRRPRRARFGELVQIDGSDHDWFGEEEARSCLLNMVDDATSRTMSQMDKGETGRVLLTTFKQWVEKYGVPLSVYVDLKNLYVSPHRLKISGEDEKIEDSWNVFERVCGRLGVEIIKAYSPQAKGRVERSHGTYQDRLVKELKLKGIKTIEAANAFLANGFVDKLNSKFARPAESQEDAHRDAKGYGDLEQIFCWEYERQVKLDYTIQFKNEHYQLQKSTQEIIRPKQKVTVRVHLDSQITLWRNEKKLAYQKIEAPAKKLPVAKIKLGHDPEKLRMQARKHKHKSPWSQFNKNWLSRKNRIQHANTGGK